MAIARRAVRSSSTIRTERLLDAGMIRVASRVAVPAAVSVVAAAPAGRADGVVTAVGAVAEDFFGDDGFVPGGGVGVEAAAPAAGVVAEEDFEATSVDAGRGEVDVRGDVA